MRRHPTRRHLAHRTTLHRTSAAVTGAAVALLLAGCGGTQGGGANAQSATVSPTPSDSASQSTSPSPSASPSTPPPASASASPSRTGSPSGSAGSCAAGARLDAGDSGRTVCLARGQVIRLTLDGTEDRPWKAVTAEGGALKAANPGSVVQPGDAVAAFEAVTPGTARLTSSRPLCATRPGQMSCKAVQEWTVTVEVR